MPHLPKRDIYKRWLSVTGDSIYVLFSQKLLRTAVCSPCFPRDIQGCFLLCVAVEFSKFVELEYLLKSLPLIQIL